MLELQRNEIRVIWHQPSKQLKHVAEDIHKIIVDKHPIIYLYCRSGNRFGQALKILERQSSSHVVNAGGIADTSELLK